jgi:hypothetical protein
MMATRFARAAEAPLFAGVRVPLSLTLVARMRALLAAFRRKKAAPVPRRAAPPAPDHPTNWDEVGDMFRGM